MISTDKTALLIKLRSMGGQAASNRASG